MSTVRIAVASTPLTATLDEAVPAADRRGRGGRAAGCRDRLPAGDRACPATGSRPRDVPDVTRAELDRALDEVAVAARRAGVVTIVGTERPVPGGREIVSVVLGADGTPPRRAGARRRSTRPRRPTTSPGSGRRVFTAAGADVRHRDLPRGVPLPGDRRALALDGAQVVFVPHFVTTDDGSLPAAGATPSNPYNEKALMCRALENTVYVAQSNDAGPDQGSVTCIIAPDGSLVASLPYGTVGVVAADIDLAEADRRLALRWAPERNAQPVGETA